MRDLLIVGAAGVAYLILAGAVDERDHRIEQLEAITKHCLPKHAHELAAIQLMADGSYQCAVSADVQGRRRTIVERREM